MGITIPPTKLFHVLEGWPPSGPNCFRWEDGLLKYRLADWSLSIKQWNKVAVPTVDQWQEFWSVCDKVDVWSLPSIVRNPRMQIEDGLQYKLEFEVGDRAVKSAGQLCLSPPGFSDRVMQIHRALWAIVGFHEAPQ